MYTQLAADAWSVAADEGDKVWFTNTHMTLKATAESTGGAYGLVDARAPAGFGAPWHVHHREDEAFWVLEGRLTVKCGERTFTAGPGSFTFLPRNIPHGFVVEGDEPARILSMCAPGGLEGYFMAAGRAAETDDLPPMLPVDPGMLARVGADFGLEVLGPPLPPQG